MKNCTFLLVLLCSAFHNVLAQGGFPVYSDTSYHYLTAQKMVMNTDGSFVVLASNELNFGSWGSFGFVVSKYSASGAELWTTSFNTPSGTASSGMYATDMIKAADSGYIITADSETQNSTVIDKYSLNLYKLNENGQLVWEHTDYNASSGEGYGYLSFVCKEQLANEYVVLNFDSINKYDLSGDFLGSEANPGIYFSFAENSFDSLIGVGTMATPALLFMDSNANVAHTTALHASNTTYYDIQLTDDSCWLLTGIYDTSATGANVTLTKCTYSGLLVWQHAFAYNDQLQDVISTTTYRGKYYLTASWQECTYIDAASGACVGPTGLVIICTDSMGNELSELKISGNNANIDSVRSYFGLQSIISNDTIYTLGTAEWLSISGIGTGVVAMSPYVSSYIVWKYPLSAFTPVLSASATVIDDAVTLFPNPCQNSLTIETDANSYSNCTITNLLGEVVVQKNIDERVTTINLDDWSSGLYFIMLNGSKGILVKRFVKE